MSREEVNKILRGVVWDYNIEPYELYQIALEQSSEKGFLSKENILLRFIQRLSWYEIQSLFTIDYLKNNLTPSLLNRIRNKQIKHRYELILKVLRGETLSLTGWDFENRKRIKSAVLSNRRYST